MNYEYHYNIVNMFFIRLHSLQPKKQFETEK